MSIIILTKSIVGIQIFYKMYLLNRLFYLINNFDCFNSIIILNKKIWKFIVLNVLYVIISRYFTVLSLHCLKRKGRLIRHWFYGRLSKEHTKYMHILHVVITGRHVNAFLADIFLVTQLALRWNTASWTEHLILLSIRRARISVLLSYILLRISVGKRKCNGDTLLSTFLWQR